MARRNLNSENRRRPIVTNYSEGEDIAVTQQQIPDNIGGMGEKLSKALQQTPGQKKKAKRDKARKRVYFDAPEDLLELLEKLKDREGVSKSRLVSFLIILGLQKFSEGNVQFEDYKSYPNYPGVSYTLNMPDIPIVDLSSAKFKNEDG
jgi:hypothetical protein